MDCSRIGRIECSFNVLAPEADTLINRFYDRLFADHPGVRGMFPNDMTEQKGKLLASIKLVVSNLREPDKLAEPLREMGRWHVAYGTQPEHYPIVRDTLLASMAELAGDLWTDELEADWTDALNAVAGQMLEGHRAALDEQGRQAA